MFAALKGARGFPRAAVSALCFLVGITLAPAAFAQTQQALQFNGSSQYVTFGAAPSLGASSFTVELRFKRSGAGTSTTTGTNGWANIVPLLTKGRGEQETPDNLNMNYFLGIRSDGRLAADFEEPTGPNHPIGGKVTTIANGTWYHAAVTYDATTRRYMLYLNGVVENDTTLGVGIAPAAVSIQHAALGTAMTSTGVAAGFFQGIVDEARIWNVARSSAQILDDSDAEVLSGTGLIGRWGLNEGAGANAGNSIANSVDGTLVGTPTWTTDSPLELSTEAALRFGGSNGYVTFGNPGALHLSNFTVETWFRRDGAGVSNSTGTGGVDAVPLVARGTGEDENPTIDMNYYMGIRASDNVLIADMEEGAAGAAPSQNHPVAGVTPIVNGTWYHAAATYDGTTWRLYLNGALEASSTVGQPAAAAGNQLASLATGLTSTGVPEGFFDGSLDEARVWNLARSQAQIQASMNSKIVAPTAGLVARWGLDEDALVTVHSSAGTALDGTITGTAWSWAGSAPFNAVTPTPPSAPSGLTATANGGAQINLAWTDGSGNEANFEIERSLTGSGGPFSFLASVPANTVAYSDNGLSPSTPYCYRVRAVNGGGQSGYAGPACTTTGTVTNTALDFAGTNAYASFGNPASLKLTNFTLEMWMRRDGAGTGTDTGSGGIPDLIPLIAKGRAETEAAAVDVNYIFGIRASDNVLAADFEEAQSGAIPSQNHPVIGTQQITVGPWHHVAATYDGTDFKLYLDGVLEATTAAGQPAASASDVAVAIGSALNSTNVASGFFNGAVDEVRIWNVARTLGQIQSTANAQLTTPQTGLVARWSLDEGAGTTVGGSAGTTVNGNVTGSGFTWTAGAPFNLSLNLPPNQPSLIVPANNATGVSKGPSLYVSASDPDGGNVTVSWYGRSLTSTPGPDFTLIGMPDTQYYTGQLNGGTNAMLKTITSWIVANRAARNIQYIATLGDCVEHGDAGDGISPNPAIEWMRADTAYSAIENPGTTGLPNGIPYGITVGNHDQSPNADATGTTTFYNQYFGEARFTGRPYYRGHYGSNNDNWYDFFSASGMDFIVISMEYDTAPDQPVLDWADQLLTTYSTRRAIILTHYLTGTGNPSTFSSQGTAIYNALRGHSNLFLMMGGHVTGEGRRVDTFGGNTVLSVESDYQGRANGGNGWTRIMEFSPANNVIRVRTYSPTLGQFEADSDSSSQFTLPYNMSSSAPFALIGSAVVPSGSSTAMVWPGRTASTQYEWYSTVSDGSITTTGPTWAFTTSATVDVGPSAPLEIALGPIMPNPTHGRAHMSFALPRATSVRLSVLDIQGREVAVLAQGNFEAGRHSVEWNGRGNAGSVRAGLYLVRLQTPGRTDVKKMVWAR